MPPRADLLSLLLLVGCSASPATGLDCPKPETGALAGTIRESAAQIKQSGSILRNGGEAGISELAATLETRHPGASRSAMINYMITAYCPVIDADAGGVDAKRNKLSAFSQRVSTILQRPPAQLGNATE